MLWWTPYALVRVVIFFIAGILLAIYQPHLLEFDTAVILLLGLVILYIVLGTLTRLNGIQFNIGTIGLVVVAVAGYVHLLHSAGWNNERHFMYANQPISFYQVSISSDPEEKGKSWKVEGEIRAIFYDSAWQKSAGRVLMYFAKADLENPLQYGDRLIIQGAPQILEGPANPGEFDYKRFLSFKNIYHQHFIRNNIVRVERGDKFAFRRYAIQCRQWAKRVLDKYVDGEKELAIASALILGIKDGLDNELIQSYSASGAMHVLAVSGLHVGIVYWILLILLKPVSRLTYGPWIIAFISIAILWAYAFITGLSPSVLRAVTMFSFVACARPFNYSTNIYNTLAASAFCLLLFNPYLIMSVGFQLSYVAVLGIVYLQPILYQAWNPKSLLADKVWQITSVSIAAQVATFTLGLLYFHQFPVYFLVSNLFVIPGAVIILSGGIFLLAISFIAPLAEVIGVGLETVISMINIGVSMVEAFPFSLIEDVYITTAQCWLLIGSIVFIVWMLVHRRFALLQIAFVLVLLFSFFQWKHFISERQQPKVTIYSVPGASAVDFMDGNKAFFLSDSTLSRDHERIKFHIRPNRLRTGILDVESIHGQPFVAQYDGANIVSWHGMMVLSIESRNFKIPHYTYFDYIIVGKNAVSDLQQVESLNFKKLILDSSNSYYFAERILKQAGDQENRIYSVLHKGAFTINVSKL